jgi:hypothetical protein
MKKRVILLLSFCGALINCGNNQNHAKIKSGYVKFEYIGESDKPVPVIVLYTEGSFDTSSIQYGDFFRISISEFELIENSIKASKSLPQSELRGNYNEFTVVKDMEKFVLMTIDKNSTQQLFDKIIKHISDENIKKIIKLSFDNIIRRLFSYSPTLQRY